jgi:tRNA dimethylallyltransferase
MQMPKPEVVILIGPTAVGKTAVSIPLARALDAEIVSADSRQVYIGLDIGTAKPSMAERAGITHHLVDILSLSSDFSVADFQKLAFEAVEEIHSRGKKALVVGGTGLYVRALLDRPSYQNQPPDPSLRKAIHDEIADRGAQAVYDEFAKADPEGASKIHPNNIPRLVRAVEVMRLTGRPFSESVRQDRERREESPYKWRIVGLIMPRGRLYDRIDGRTTEMIQRGWLDEVRGLLGSGATGDEKPLAGLGYRDIVAYLRGQENLGQAIENISRDTRRFAKRQVTYFKMLEGISWIDLQPNSDPESVAREIAANQSP